METDAMNTLVQSKPSVRPAILLTGAVMLSMLVFAAASRAEQAPQAAATVNDTIYRSHVEWRAAAVTDEKQTASTWTVLNSHVVRAGNASWLPILPPDEVAKLPADLNPIGDQTVDHRR
jgi:hypothetical protein